MSNASTALSAAALASSAAANAKAQEAKDTAEERLEGTATFVIIQDYDLESTDQIKSSHWLFGRKYKKRLVLADKYTLKHTDIAYMKEKKDDFGKVYTKIYTEDRCDIDVHLYVEGTIESVTKMIQDQVR